MASFGVTKNEPPTVHWLLDQSGPDPRIVQLANGAPFPEQVTATTSIDAGPVIEISVQVDDGHPVMTRFAIERRAGGDPLTASAIHNVPVGNLLEQLIAYLGWGAELMQRGHDQPGVLHRMPTDDERESAGRRAVTSQRGRPVGEDDLRKVATIVANNSFDPRQKVREELGLSERTASRWIAAARRRGFVDEITSGREEQ